MKLIIARATAGDAIWFKATIDRIAEILAKQGDTDTVEVRRSTAIGILAQPAQALQLLCQHQHDNWDGPTEPADDESCDAEPSDVPLPDLDPGDPETSDAVEELEGKAARTARPARSRILQTPNKAAVDHCS